MVTVVLCCQSRLCESELQVGGRHRQICRGSGTGMGNKKPANATANSTQDTPPVCPRLGCAAREQC